MIKMCVVFGSNICAIFTKSNSN